jgi:hypothetical protein
LGRGGGHPLLRRRRGVLAGRHTRSRVFLVGLVCIIIALFLGYRVLGRRDLGVTLYEVGFSYTSGGKRLNIRWQDIENITQAITTYRAYGLPLQTERKYKINLKGDQSLLLTDDIRDVEQLGQNIQSRFTKYLLPIVARDLKEGKEVAFGQVTISSQGIRAGKNAIRWAEIHEVSLREGWLNIKKEGRWFRWAALPVAQIPNFFTLLAIMEKALGPGKIRS